MTTTPAPVLHNVVLDTPDARRLAEFYRELLGWSYRGGDEPPPPGQPDPDGVDWLVLRPPAGGAGLAFQQIAELPTATWPDGPVPQQLHLDMTAADPDELQRFREHAEQLGARLLQDRFDDPQEQLYVFADPDGHPFCIFVG